MVFELRCETFGMDTIAVEFFSVSVSYSTFGRDTGAGFNFRPATLIRDVVSAVARLKRRDRI